MGRGGGALAALLGVAALCGVALFHYDGSAPSSLLSERASSRPVPGAVVRAMEKARKSAAALSHVATEVKELDAIREHMWSQLSKAGGSRSNGVGQPGSARVASLKSLADGDTLLMARLSRAASAEKALLLQSEEIADGKCDDHHKEVCDGGSCCAFWAKKGQCGSGEEHGAWMSTYCAQSCNRCGATDAVASAARAVLAHASQRAAKQAPPLPQEVSFSMVLHGVDGADTATIDAALRHAGYLEVLLGRALPTATNVESGTTPALSSQIQDPRVVFFAL
ncbi:hypothetical protein T484DRAFT_1843965 [Baffinella frigidus]|nr:hypothetical protein T484DRAFT_1843965 [Cryptophyta sp. CCMP2293]